MTGDLDRSGRRRPAAAGRWRVVQEVLHEALARPREGRARFLEMACAGDRDLLAEVRGLIDAHESVGKLDRLATEVMGPLLAPLRTGPDRIPGHFEVLGEVGRGGMGVVYRARDVRLEREVSLKVLPPGPRLSEEARARFVEEARAAGRLDHPNLCTVHEIGETAEGGLFIAMPFYGGRTLKDLVAKGPSGWQMAAELGVQVARGLGAAHDAGLVHRDIKPANVCVTPEGVVKIVDFGIAKAGGDPAAPAEATRGTAAYMSPEQVRGEAVGPGTDLWSLGVVLYELLTGARLFTGDDASRLLEAIRSTQPVDLTELAGAAPAALQRLLERLLARDPRERPPSAAVVAERLESILDSTGEIPQGGWKRPHGGRGNGERRQATVLELRAGARDPPEGVGPEGPARYPGLLRTTVEDIAWRHGGVLTEVDDDRAVLVFGIPVTREDDVGRALLAAMDLHAAIGRAAGPPGDGEPRLRAGVARGIVRVHPHGTGPRELRLSGEPLVRASRLAAAAPVGSTWIEASGARGAGPGWLLEPVDGRPGAGEPSGLEALRVRGPSGRAASRPTLRPSRLTPYTGRDVETATLLAGLERALAGTGQVVTVTGEAGSGKSRLVLEFSRTAEARSARVVQGGCPSHPAAGPYHPFVEVLLDLFGATARTTGADMERQVLAAIDRFGGELESFIPWYLHLLSVSSEHFQPSMELQGEAFRVAMRQALVALVTAVSLETPLVLILEDWQWVDDASHEVLGQLAELVGTCSLFIVVTARPGHDRDLGALGRHSVIHLGALGPGDSSAMVGSILGAEDVPAAVATAVHERAGGNPFFIEELCEGLREAGVLKVRGGRVSLAYHSEQLDLPSTVQGTVRARLDRLPPEAREVLRAASVLGRTFDHSLLEMLVPEPGALPASLHALVELGLVQRTAVVPEPRYRFKHVLTQEVAYDTLLDEQRVELHRKAGHAIETHLPERLAEDMPVLAHHFSRAEEWLKAVRYGRAAAERTRGLNEFADTLQQLEAVDRWLARLPADDRRRELEVETLFQQEEMCEALGLRDGQQELLDRLEGLLAQEADPSRLAEVHRRRGDVFTLSRRFDEARTVLGTALELARDTDDRKLKANVFRSLGLADWHDGRFESARSSVEEAIRLDREIGDVTCLITDLNNKGHVLKDLKEYDLAIEAFEEAVSLLDESPDDVQKYYTMHNISNLYRDRGDLEMARGYLDAAGELLGVGSLPVHRGVYLSSVANFHLQCGDTEAALETYEEAVALGRRARYPEGLAHSARPLGELLAMLGRPAEALPYLREAATLFGQLGNLAVAAAIWVQTAEVAFQLGDLPGAEEAWCRAEELGRELGRHEVLIDALEGLGRARRELGEDMGRARRPLEEALALAEAHQDRPRQGRVLNGLGIVEWKSGDYARALGRYEAALALYRDLDDPVHLGLVLNSLGVTLRALGDREAARARLIEALEVHERTGERLLEGHALAALGDLSRDVGDLEGARESFGRSLEVRRAIADRPGEGWMQQRLARVHHDAGRPDAARTCLDAARQIAAEVNDPELFLACSEATE